jgi:PEP-CTERM motif
LRSIAVFVLFSALSLAARGASFATAPAADAFVTTGPSDNLRDNNYGGAGSIAVSTAAAPQREFQSVLRFAMGGAVSSFDATYGAGHWTLQSIVLQLTAAPVNNAMFNASTAGSFSVSWMQNDSWVEGTGTPAAPTTTGITWRTLHPGPEQDAGTFAFSGATSGTFNYSLTLAPALVADVLAGDDVSLRMFAADGSVSGLFYSRSFGTVANRPSLTLTAVPEPGTFAQCALGVALLAASRRRAA